MKKVILFSLLSIFAIASFTSCNTYKSASKATGVSTPMLGQVGNVLLKDMTGMLEQAGMSAIASKLSMNTKVGSLIKGAQMVGSFKKMLSGNYQIPMANVEKAYSGFGTIQDVAGFVGKNASPSFLNTLK